MDKTSYRRNGFGTNKYKIKAYCKWNFKKGRNQPKILTTFPQLLVGSSAVDRETRLDKPCFYWEDEKALGLS